MSPKATNRAAADAPGLTLTTSHSSSKGPKAASKSSSPSPTTSQPAQFPPRHQSRARGASSSSPSDDRAPRLPPRPGGPRRSSSQDGNFFSNVKKGKEQVKAGGLKAASFLDKVSHVAWDRIKSPRLNPLNPTNLRVSGGRSSSPQSGNKNDPNRDTSNDVDVFGMDLKEAVIKTRIISVRKMPGDATYWIPAIAYRCLQYLNVYGPHEIGIYRLSGSTVVVDDLRAEFKIRHDVDLFENPPDDLHTVSSLLKGWFRSLPDAILPLEVQKRIYEKCKDETESPKPPKAFVDELSNLPPYNYYLLNHLFSHLSTICMESEINKMNLSNLGMIFCSTLRIDRFCFNWLVNSWADCWAGCLTEEDEYHRTLPPPPPRRLPSMDSANPPQILSSNSRASSRTGRPIELDGSSQERWPSTSSRDLPTSSASSIQHPPRKDSREPIELGREKEKDRGGRIDWSQQKEKLERGQEEKKERVPLESRRHKKEPSSLSLSPRTDEPHYDDRYSTMVQHGSPRTSSDGNRGRLSPPASLPPIQPLSPMIKEGQNVV
ncbi:Rho GTPase activation protein [Sphaerosporella brunnea]|uniref:Rho GTPase activation protein n=1 Tax=Sphaerosporella brunnea TaxID=1250544 RepID=A0A5J5ER65_9PEZI|nr:Rho GTPase activation protein [Sphaerosporella brunnea]